MHAEKTGIEASDYAAVIAPELKTLANKLGDKKFFAGETPGYGEAFVWHNIDNIKAGNEIDAIKAAIGDKKVVDKLNDFHKRFSELDGIKEYLVKRGAKAQKEKAEAEKAEKAKAEAEKAETA